MSGETDLKTLLATMRPHLHGVPYVFCTVNRETFAGLSVSPVGTFQEEEGVTLILTQQQALNQGLAFEMLWACVTLTVHSALSAVGFLAAITTRLAEAGISVNPVSAYYHDHLFVPWERRQEVVAILENLQKIAAA
jgi:hypothetical protein